MKLSLTFDIIEVYYLQFEALLPIKKLSRFIFKIDIMPIILHFSVKRSSSDLSKAFQHEEYPLTSPVTEIYL